MPDEVVNEIAGHLEELYESSRNHGMDEGEAIEHCLMELESVAEVGGRILQSKGGSLMNSRVKRVWIPGLVAWLAALALEMLFPRLGWHTSIVVRHGVVFAMYIPWLMALPFCGAMGAYLSRRNGGDWAATVLSGLFPAIAAFAAFCAVVLSGILIEHNSALFQHPIGFLRMLRDRTLFPAIALLVGVLPVCLLVKGASAKSASLA